MYKITLEAHILCVLGNLLFLYFDINLISVGGYKLFSELKWYDWNSNNIFWHENPSSIQHTQSEATIKNMAWNKRGRDLLRCPTHRLYLFIECDSNTNTFLICYLLAFVYILIVSSWLLLILMKNKSFLTDGWDPQPCLFSL